MFVQKFGLCPHVVLLVLINDLFKRVLFLWELRPASITNRRMLPLLVYPSDLRVHVNACAQSTRVAAYVPSFPHPVRTRNQGRPVRKARSSRRIWSARYAEDRGKKNGGGLEEKGGTALVVIVFFFDSGVECRNIRGIWGLRNLLRPLLQLGPHSRRRVI